MRFDNRKVVMHQYYLLDLDNLFVVMLKNVFAGTNVKVVRANNTSGQ